MNAAKSLLLLIVLADSIMIGGLWFGSTVSIIQTPPNGFTLCMINSPSGTHVSITFIRLTPTTMIAYTGNPMVRLSGCNGQPVQPSITNYNVRPHP